MADAAAESILLAAAVAKSGDEAKILKMYDAAGGRARVTTNVTGQATTAVQRQFVAALHILHYWRDDAAHGQQTTISEVEAYSAISELLRLARRVRPLDRTDKMIMVDGLAFHAPDIDINLTGLGNDARIDENNQSNEADRSRMFCESCTFYLAITARCPIAAI